MVLSYVPFKYEEDEGTGAAVGEATGPKEGLWDNSRTNFLQRKHDQDEIVQFTDHIFGSRRTLTFENYSQINQNMTSEMFTSIMRVLHEMLPCSRNFFSMKRNYRQTRDNASDIQPKIKEIATPRMVRGLSLGRSPSRKLSSRSCSSVGS